MGPMNLRGVWQQDEMATLSGCRLSCRFGFGQSLNSRYFLFYLTALFEALSCDLPHSTNLNQINLFFFVSFSFRVSAIKRMYKNL